MAENSAATAAAGDANQNQARFALQRIYIKDLSFESPKSPLVFQQQWKPQVHMDLNTRSEKVRDDFYEVVVSLTLTIKNEEETAYIIEIQQAGIFNIASVEGPQLQQLLGAHCPNILFPYAREAIDNMVLKGSFPPLMLAPVDFGALYVEALKRKAAEQEKSEEAAH